MTEQDMHHVEDAFVSAIRRCEIIGCEAQGLIFYSETHSRIKSIS